MTIELDLTGVGVTGVIEWLADSSAGTMDCVDGLSRELPAGVRLASVNMADR